MHKLTDENCIEHCGGGVPVFYISHECLKSNILIGTELQIPYTNTCFVWSDGTLLIFIKTLQSTVNVIKPLAYAFLHFSIYFIFRSSFNSPQSIYIKIQLVQTCTNTAHLSNTQLERKPLLYLHILKSDYYIGKT